MSQLKRSFEIALKDKLSQKATANFGDEVVLLKSFRYFDANNDGCVSLNEWYKAIEKIGVVVPTLNDLKELFYTYDTDADGLLNYKEFSDYLYCQKPLKYFSFLFISEHPLLHQLISKRMRSIYLYDIKFLGLVNCWYN